MKKGFTMAEVLITIGIIGIIAAITIPQVIEGYKKKEVVTRLKRNYSLILQAIRASESKNGELRYWDSTLTGHDFFETYIKEFFSNPIEISTAELKTKVKRKTLKGTNYGGTTYNGDNSTHFYTNDGSLITLNLNASGEAGLWVGIDVNGNQQPNTVGKDTFLFFFSTKKGLIPLGYEGTPTPWVCTNCSREKLKQGGSHSCNLTGSGYWCAALIVNDNWEIKKDYPW